MADNGSSRIDEENSSINKTYMQKLKKIFDQVGLRNELVHPGEKTTAEHILVALTEKESDLPIIAQVMFLNDLYRSELEDISAESDILQFMVNLPTILISESDIFTVSTLILRINQFLPLGAFGISSDHHIYFRYGLIDKDKESIEKAIIIEVLDMINFFIPIIAKNIEKYADNEISLDQCLKNIEEELEPGIDE